MATLAASGNNGDRLSEVLLREGLLTREQLASAMAEQKTSKHRLGYVLVKLGFMPELEITKILARQYKMPAVDLSRFEVDPRIAKLVPADLAIKDLVLPLKREGRTLTVAMADPTNLGVLEDLKFITRYDIFPVIGRRVHAPRAIEKHYAQRSSRSSPSLLKDIEATGEDVEVVEEQEEETAARSGADRGRAGRQADQRHPHRRGEARARSDIHFECFEHEIRVRYRIDGALLEIMKPPAEAEGGAHLALQDHVAAQHRRAPRAAGRPHQAEDGQEGHRLPRVDAARAVRREDRAPNSRQGEPDARPREVRHRAEGGEGPHGGDPEPVRHGARHRPDGLRQDDDAVLRAVEGQHASTSTS